MQLNKNRIKGYILKYNQKCAQKCLKLERFYEKDGFLFEKRCPAILLKQGSTADIFQGNYQLFLTKQFHKNNSERLIGKGVHLFSKPNYYCFGMATVEV